MKNLKPQGKGSSLWYSRVEARRNSDYLIKPIVNFRTIISTDLQRKERRDIIKDLKLETRRPRISLQGLTPSSYRQVKG